MMKLHPFHFTPHGIVRAYSHIVAGRRLCRTHRKSLRSFIPESVNSMTAAWNYDQTLRNLRITPPSTIIDVGANVSQMTKLLMLSSCVEPKVISFEPNRNVKPIGTHMQIALSDRDGESDFYLPHDDSTWGTIEPHKKDTGVTPGHYAVREARLDTLVRTGEVEWDALPRPILVKVDTEGSEQRVLTGFGDLLHDVSILVVEVENREERGENYDLLSLGQLVRPFEFTRCKILYACYDGPVSPAYSDVMIWKDSQPTESSMP